MPRIVQANRSETFDIAVMRELGEMGFLGATLHGYGCAGIGYVAFGLVARELERVDTSFRSACTAQSSLAMTPIYAYGSETQRQRFLPRMAKGELLGCFGLTEPDHGSDPGSMLSRARKVDGGWRLRGTKLWITHAPIADVLHHLGWTTQARFRGFILERGMPGLSTPRSKAVPVRASPTGEVVMDDVFVPADNLLPGAHGLKGRLDA
jgi:glutaryl-CoA dehydrogenase